MRSPSRFRVVLAVLVLILVPFARGNWILPLFLVFFPLATLISQETIKILTKKWFLAFASTLILVIPVLSPGRDAKILFIAYSQEMFALGIQMTAKALVFFSWLRILLSSFTPLQILRFFERMGMRDLGVKVTVAMNILPLLAESIRISWESLRMRRKMLSPRFLFCFSRTVMVNTVRMAEDLALASYLKGYGVKNDMDSDR